METRTEPKGAIGSGTTSKKVQINETTLQRPERRANPLMTYRSPGRIDPVVLWEQAL